MFGGGCVAVELGVVFHEGYALAFHGVGNQAGGFALGGGSFVEGASPAYVSDFLATSEGLALTRAFTRIGDSKMRRSIVELVEQIAARDGPDQR